MIFSGAPLLPGSLALCIGLMSLLVSSTASAACTAWASPDAGAPSLGLFGAAGSRENPIRVSDFWKRAKPGDTLCLMNGHYTRKTGMIRPPKGLSGLPGAPITVRAENDGGVLIDGGLKSGSKIKSPVRLRHNSYFVLEGFDVAYSNTGVIGISGSWDPEAGRTQLERKHWDPIEHVTLRRIVAWDANPKFAEYHACDADPKCDPKYRKGFHANFHVVDVAAAKNVLIEDVAAFGTGRKIFQVILSEDVTIRRAWGRWEGNASTHTQTFSCAYRSYQSLCENVIGTWSAQQQDPKIDIRGQLKSIIGMDWFKKNDSWQTPSDPFDSGLRVLGSFGYLKAGVEPPPEHVVLFGYGKNETLHDVVAYSGNDTIGVSGLTLVGCIDRVSCTWAQGKKRSAAALQASAMTVIGGNGRPSIHADWKNSTGYDAPILYPLSASNRPNVFSTQTTPQTGTSGATPDQAGAAIKGASLCHRYVDGVLTEEPLWPWPMNDRIRAATWYAHGEATDVQAEVEAILGEIPAACRAQVDSAASPGAPDAGAPTPHIPTPQASSPEEAS